MIHMKENKNSFKNYIWEAVITNVQYTFTIRICILFIQCLFVKFKQHMLTRVHLNRMQLYSAYKTFSHSYLADRVPGWAF